MRLKLDQLDAQLRKGLLPVYLVTGDEPLLCQEALDTLRATARQQGFDTREVFHAEAGFRSDDFLASALSLSLFGDRKLLELRLPGGKASADVGKAIAAYCDSPGEDTVLLISADRLERGQDTSAWFKAVDSLGAVLQVWPLEARALPRWLDLRARRLGLELAPDALELLALRVEGNLLAAAQELEKLRLAGLSGAVDTAIVEQAVADSARYSSFTLLDRALAGEAADALRVLRGLHGEGEELLPLLGLLSRELRQLHQLAQLDAEGMGFEQAARQLHLREARKPLLRAALRRLSPAVIEQLLSLASRVDRAVKGAPGLDAWRLMELLIARLAGAQPLTYRQTLAQSAP